MKRLLLACRVLFNYQWKPELAVVKWALKDILEFGWISQVSHAVSLILVLLIYQFISIVPHTRP